MRALPIMMKVKAIVLKERQTELVNLAERTKVR
jgi:hypothetical protein